MAFSFKGVKGGKEFVVNLRYRTQSFASEHFRQNLKVLVNVFDLTLLLCYLLRKLLFQVKNDLVVVVVLK